MYRLGLLSCILFVIVSGNVVRNDNARNLKWPEKYSFEAEKVYVIGGSVEDIKYWRSENISRIDYNNGAKKTLSIIESDGSRTKYEVHAETTEKKENSLVCEKETETLMWASNLDDILPNVGDFKYMGSEWVEQQTVAKFYYREVDLDVDNVHTIWAIENYNEDTSRPLRYEYIEYNTWLDSPITHHVWNYYNFDTDFNSSTVFNFEKIYECKDSTDSDDIYNTQKNDIDPENENHVNEAFESYKDKHNKIYSDTDEHSMRKNIFQNRMRLVLENNRKNTGFKLAINKFADRTPEELERYLGLIQLNLTETDTLPFPYTKSQVEKLARTLPKEYDLRDLGIISPVKNQEGCKSCWTFATTTAVEGALARQNGGRLLRLSTQALLDCAWGFDNKGCNGGNDIGAYKWIQAHGLPTEQEYGPYANEEGFCHIHNMTKLYRIRGYTKVTPLSVEALKVALVNHGPITVQIHATSMLHLYNGGIYYDTECNHTRLNQLVTLVGYGQHAGEEFWIVKNSWGQNWGIDGYLYISVRDDNCGITRKPTYVEL